MVAAYAVSVSALVKVITELVAQTAVLEQQVKQGFGRHSDAETYLSQPGLGPVLRARVLAEFGDDPHRYLAARARKNYAGTSPITKTSGKKTVISARFVRNRRLADALHQQALCALTSSAGARALYDHRRAVGDNHHKALRALANRLVGILHGCLARGIPYDETIAWNQDQQAAA